MVYMRLLLIYSIYNLGYFHINMTHRLQRLFFYHFSNVNHNNKHHQLQQLSTQLSIPLTPPTFIQDNKPKRLTSNEKLQLGLLIPLSPFNPRLTKFHQSQYI